MSHDVLALTGAAAARRPYAPNPPALLAAPKAGPMPAPAFAGDTYLPATRPAAGDAALRAQVAALRSELEALTRRLEAVTAALAAAGPADPLAGVPGSDPLPEPGTPHHAGADQVQDTQSLTDEFAKTDADGSGALDFAEVLAHEEGDQTKATLHFGDADRDRSGLVDLDEWVWHHQNSPLHVGPQGTPGPTPAGDLAAPPDHGEEPASELPPMTMP